MQKKKEEGAFLMWSIKKKKIQNLIQHNSFKANQKPSLTLYKQLPNIVGNYIAHFFFI